MIQSYLCEKAETNEIGIPTNGIDKAALFIDEAIMTADEFLHF